MGGRDEGLTPQGLADRLASLERANEKMRSENIKLRDEVARLRDSGTRRARDERPTAEIPEPFDPKEPFNRRRLLSRAGAAAAGLVIAGALTQRDIREAKAAIVKATTDTANRGAVEGTNRNISGYGVWGNAASHYGVYGTGQVGVFGEGTSYGLFGLNRGNNGVGVFANGNGKDGVGAIGIGDIGIEGRGRIGVSGTGRGTFGPGVFGENKDAVGVSGKGKIGVSGISSATGFPAVHGRHTGPGGIGVRGDGPNDGYGGRFQGGKAQLRLVPSENTTGSPTTGTHSQGEIFMDLNANLFVCTDGGTPGTWEQIAIVG
jgi:hypothetical protein